MELSFGARLRQQREQQQLDVVAIAARMKIKASLLDELERDDVSHWPAGIYRRAYLRDYARAIGLDPEPIVREFLELYPDPMLAPPTEPQGEGEPATPPAETTRLRRLLGAVPLLRRRSEPEPVGVTLSRLIASAQEQETPAVASVPLASTIDEPLSEAADLSFEGMQGDEEIEIDFDALDLGIPVADEVIVTMEAVDETAPVADVTPVVELAAVADVCTRLARASNGGEIVQLLGQAARLIQADGVMIWAWDARRKVLTPSLAHGYSDAVLERLPSVRADAQNAIAAAFRSVSLQAVDSHENSAGAIAVPLVAPDGCIGVLALEVRSGVERDESMRAVAGILAAQLAAVLVVVPASAAVSA